MDYSDKYLKYKFKYEKLQNNQQDVTILLMFLGGLPSDDNIEIYNHWKNIIECSKSKINYKIIVHPIDITNYNIPTIWNEFDVNIVDIDHHVGTKWATRSLVDATLLMMQYGRIKFKNIKKYVLLSNTCIPLYNLDNLYNAFMSNSKSWLMSYSENENARDHLVYLQEVNGGLFNLYERNYFSQWMSLDRIHADYFFVDNEPYTYIIEKNIDQTKKKYCGQTNKVIINNTIQNTPHGIELIKLLNSFDSHLWDSQFNHENLIKNPCSPIDEHFFGMYIYYKLLHNMNINDYIKCLLNNIMAQTDKQIHDKLIYLKKFDTELNINFNNINFNKTTINLNNMNTYCNNIIDIYPYSEQHVYTPGPYNLNKIKKQFFIKTYKSFDNNTYIINQNRDAELKTQTNSNDGKYTTNIVSKYYPISSTYTDWDSWSPDPFNVLRDCIIPNTTFNLKRYLNFNSTKESLDYLISLDNTINPNSNININELNIKMPNYHPLEYTEWTLQNIINAYILLSYFSNIFIRPEKQWPQNIFKWAYDSWKNYICNNFNNYDELLYIININDKTYSIQFIDCLKNIIEDPHFIYDKNKNFGCYITPDVLTSAISSGALFIRKCTNNCGISAYTNIICKLNYLKINNTVKKVSKYRYWKWTNSSNNNRNSSIYIINEIIKYGKENNYNQILNLILDCNCFDNINIYKKILKTAIYNYNTEYNDNNTEYNFKNEISNFMIIKINEYNKVFNNFKIWLLENYNKKFIIKYNKYFFTEIEFKKYMKIIKNTKSGKII